MMKFEDLPEELKLQLRYDMMIFGNAYCEKKPDGTYERLDPLKIAYDPKGNQIMFKSPESGNMYGESPVQKVLRELTILKGQDELDN